LVDSWKEEEEGRRKKGRKEVVVGF